MKPTKTLSPNMFAQQLSKRLKEGLLLFSVACGLLFFVALITYHPTDPAWSHVSMSARAINAGGMFGAYVADVFLFFFGLMAYCFPLLIIYGAFRYCLSEMDTKGLVLQAIVMRSLGLLAFVLSGCGLAALYIPVTWFTLPNGAGGALGMMVGLNLTLLLNTVGTTVILSALLLAGITLMTGLSWIGLLRYAGGIIKRFCLDTDQVLLAGLKNIWVRCKQLGQRCRGIFSWRREQSVAANQPNMVPSRVIPKSASRAPKAPEVSPVAPVMIHEAVKPESGRVKKLFSRREEVPGLPSINLLDQPIVSRGSGYSEQALEDMSREVEARLQDFNVDAKVVAVHPGPVVTRFELALAPGVKVSKISGLAKDLARSLSAISVRIVEVIPGKSVVGLELPNVNREVVRFSEMIAAKQYEQANSKLSLALGKDIAGHPVIVDLAKMPHLLVAGTTGSGKSVGLNAMLLSILFKATPDDVRLIMIDPKMLELSVYDGIPHLLTPVVTDMKEAANALRWCVAEMDRRYRLMAALGVRNLAGYNKKIAQAQSKGQPILDPFFQAVPGDDTVVAEPLMALPSIVVVIDELADMMMIVGKKVEELIARIAQKARAAGIHMILATQRPSVDVITGLIKANVPTRIAFQVSSRIDSRTILDQQGAEHLLGHGDMLYLAPGTGVPMRVHGAFVDDHEVHAVVDALKSSEPTDYLDLSESFELESLGSDMGGQGDDSEADPFYDRAVAIVLETRRASISNVQRRLKIGYNRAARLIEAMEAAGLVSPMESNGNREILVPSRGD